jgi:hypothetical protein
MLPAWMYHAQVLPIISLYLHFWERLIWCFRFLFAMGAAVPLALQKKNIKAKTGLQKFY